MAAAIQVSFCKVKSVVTPRVKSEEIVMMKDWNSKLTVTS